MTMYNNGRERREKKKLVTLIHILFVKIGLAFQEFDGFGFDFDLIYY